MIEICDNQIEGSSGVHIVSVVIHLSTYQCYRYNRYSVSYVAELLQMQSHSNRTIGELDLKQLCTFAPVDTSCAKLLNLVNAPEVLVLTQSSEDLKVGN